MPAYKQIDVVVTHEAFTACVRDAWQYLLENGKRIAEHAGIKPEDIILGGTSLHRPIPTSVCLPIPVTHAGTHQDFYIKDCRYPPFGLINDKQMTDSRSAANPFHRQQMHEFQNPYFNQPMLPSIVYLFTSPSPSHHPCWSSSPAYTVPGSERPPLDRHFTYKIG